MKIKRGKESRWKNISWRSITIIAIITSVVLLVYPQQVEAKPIAAAYPSVTIAPSSVMIGEDFSFIATFDNSDADPGYGPFIRPGISIYRSGR